MKGYIALLALLTIFAVSCQKSKTGSHAPEIGFVSMEPNTIKAGTVGDTIFLNFHVQDEDADLGSDPKDTLRDIYLLDSRRADTVNLNIADTLKFDFPTIPEKAQNPSKGSEGVCTIKIPAIYLLPRDTVNGRTKDTLTYEVYITDQAKHYSNHFKTPAIYLEQ